MKGTSCKLQAFLERYLETRKEIQGGTTKCTLNKAVGVGPKS